MLQSNFIKIGLDASGGDYGEIEVCKAIINSLSNGLNIKYYIFGDLEKIKFSFDQLNFNMNNSNIEIIDSKEKIEMNDHPVFAIRNKKESSIVKAADALINGKVDAFISAGNTGALVAASQFILKPIKGIDRPVVAAILPTNDNPMVLIDSGCNVDSKPEWLYQYAILADVYYKIMFNNQNPRIALLSVGTEENKGNTLTLEAYKLIRQNHNLNFIGNVEARDLPNGICEILVTDGFAGNVFLKTYEGTSILLLKLIKEQIKSSVLSSVGGLLIKPAIKKLLIKYDATKYGGAPILGTNYLLVKCHGNSKSNEYISAIKQVYDLTTKELIKNINSNFGV